MTKTAWTFYCYKCDGIASHRTWPHNKEDRVLLSGTILRKLLSEGGQLLDHFGRDDGILFLLTKAGTRLTIQLIN